MVVEVSFLKICPNYKDWIIGKSCHLSFTPTKSRGPNIHLGLRRDDLSFSGSRYPFLMKVSFRFRDLVDFIILSRIKVGCSSLIDMIHTYKINICCMYILITYTSIHSRTFGACFSSHMLVAQSQHILASCRNQGEAKTLQIELGLGSHLKYNHLKENVINPIINMYIYIHTYIVSIKMPTKCASKKQKPFQKSIFHYLFILSIPFYSFFHLSFFFRQIFFGGMDGLVSPQPPQNEVVNPPLW